MMTNKLLFDYLAEVSPKHHSLYVSNFHAVSNAPVAIVFVKNTNKVLTEHIHVTLTKREINTITESH